MPNRVERERLEMVKKATPATQVQYRIQGRYELRIEGRMMVSSVRGPWNIRAVKGYGVASAELIRSLAGAPWVVLAKISGEPLHTAESIDELATMVRHHHELGRSGTALVFEEDSAVSRIHQLMLLKIYTLSGEPFYFAEDEASARAWLDQQLTSQPVSQS